MDLRHAPLLAALTLCTPGIASGQEGDPELSSEQSREATRVQAQFADASDAASRAAALDGLVALGEPAIARVLPLIDDTLQRAEREYFELMEPMIRGAYLDKLAALSDDEIAHVVRTRQLWKPYILNGGSHERFREVYLAPIWRMKDLVLPTAAEIDDPAVVALRARLVEYAGYEARCHALLGVDIDPTVGKLSPTSIEYAHLDQPPTFLDRLHHRERTLILIHTVAPAGARAVLLRTDEVAREIDVQEAEFVLAANEVRMLAGSIAWEADALGCAVTRDHSSDRKDGKAKGHMSDVPGKRGFPDRNRRMGARRFGSEGAGGGQDGRSYLGGLSYSGDGHGGPLYRLARNVVGVGRRANVYTSQYATDRASIHPCAATEGEEWMPPGVTARDLGDKNVSRLYMDMRKVRSLGSLRQRIDRVRSSTKPPRGIDGSALRFFAATVDLEIDALVQEIVELEAASDVYGARLRLDEAREDLEDIEGFPERVAEVAELLAADGLSSEFEAGRAYYRLCDAAKALPPKKFDAQRQRWIEKLEEFAGEHAETAYGIAAAWAVARLAEPGSDAHALLAFFGPRRR